jgi:hypothetical protein
MEDVTAIFISSKYIFYVSVWFFLNYLYKYSVYRISFCFIALVMIGYLQYVHNSSKESLHSVNLTQKCFLLNTVFICPSYRRDILWYTNVRPFHMSRTLWPIHFKFHRVIGIDGLTVCILYGEISNFHSRVMGLYSSNCRRFFVCRAVNWEPLGQFTSNFAQLLELIVLRSV